MSLADSLLADLDGLSDEEEIEVEAPKASGSMLPPPVPLKRSAAAMEAGSDEDEDDDGDQKMADGTSAVGFVPEGGVRPAEELDQEDVENTDMTGVEDVGKVAKLLGGKKLRETLSEIERYTKTPTDMSSGTGGPLEENPEYSLIVTANNLSVEVDNEILLVHKFIRDHYAPRFPELEQLIGDPWTYVAAVKAIGNAEDLTKADLSAALPPATILSITLTATSTRGRKLTNPEWLTVSRATEVAAELRTAREQIFAYVESRMAAVAPNLSAIVGTGIAAKLLGLAGGLQAFSRVPSCNIMLYGALKKTLANSHMSTSSQQRHTGFIFQSPIVQSAQVADRKRAQRAVSAKVALAARIDAGKGSRDGSYGRKVMAELQKRIEKMAEPPPNKITKALPIPQETNKKKRGGKQARKAKEAYAQTELRKLQNRMEFGKAEQETGYGDETEGLGMIGSSSGKVRGLVVDSKSKAKLSKANKQRTQLLGRAAMSNDAKSGMSTSLSFTPVQGLEIVTPSLSAAQKVQAANERWFASGTFTHATRKTGSFYISDIFPVKLGYWDLRPSWATLREQTLLDKLHDIGKGVTQRGFRVESYEIARKDGGVFMHFSYFPPSAPPPAEIPDLNPLNALPPSSIPDPASPARLFLPLLLESANAQGGFPSWLGQWWARSLNRQVGIPGHLLYSKAGVKSVGAEDKDGGTVVKGSGTGQKGLAAMAGGGRIWVVKGRQWTEDMNRFPSNRLRVEFDGPDVSQEMLYTLFRPYGKVSNIEPPSPAPAGTLRSAVLVFSRLAPAATAINCLHGYSTPTNTADFTLRRSGSPSPSPITLSRLRLYYERPLKAHAVRDWISGHPRIALPVIAFLIGTLSYTFFDPIRAFFVRAKVEGVWDLEQYSLIKYLRQRFVLPTSLGFLHGSASSPTGETEEMIGKDAWKDRVEAEKDVETWLSEYPSTFITITGPPGSGKTSLASRVLKQQNKPALIIDCAEIAKSKTDAQLVGSLADQTGYYPVFTFLSSLNGLIDLASVGLIGQKAGFSAPVDQQLRSILEIVGGALKDVTSHSQNEEREKAVQEQNRIRMIAERERRRELIVRGGWHDGRLDDVCGNGPISELGLGEEPMVESDLLSIPIHTLADGTASYVLPEPSKADKRRGQELDEEADYIKNLPIVVLKNFAQKAAKGDLWNVLAEWGASLIENRVAHVIVICEGATASKSLTKALPSKPLNSVGLADADHSNSLSYVVDKLGVGKEQMPLSVEESQQVAKLGGRMVDLETLVYKVRTGSTIQDAIDDIILRNVVELRKQAFGDDTEDAKALAWTRSQAWKVVSELAKHGETSYANLLQEFPFKGAESSLKALEEHELVSVTYVDGRASKVKPGKPVFRYAFEDLVNDPVFKASCQIEYNTALIAKAESDIKTYETELTTLKTITSDGGDSALGVSGSGWLGMGKQGAIKDRAHWLLGKMGKNVEKLAKLEADNVEQLKVLASGRA
ncbi:U4/U6 small nuclear ribonucleoprotein PRP31, partial [Tremellales sp. Uapishka_1]